MVSLCSWLRDLTSWEKWVFGLWTVIVAAVGVRVLIEPQNRTVYTIYSSSSRFWWHGSELYHPHRPVDVPTGYRYSPAFAILLTPFAWLPDGSGGMLWRCFSAACYLASLAWWARAVLPASPHGGHLALLMLLILPLSLPSVNNGQANVLVTAMLLATTAAVARKRWNLATCFLGVAVVCKVYPLVLGLLLAVLYPRKMTSRLLLMVTAALILPFAFQQPAYVLDQYGKWIASLQADDRSFLNLKTAYRDLWLLIRLYELPISRDAYVMMQLLSGAGLAGLCWYRKRIGWPEPALLTETLALAVGWMLLLGPATESCTFILLAPSLAWAGLRALQAPRSGLGLGLVLTSSGLLMLNCLAGWFPEVLHLHARGMHAWATLTWMVFLFTRRDVGTSCQLVPEVPGLSMV